MEKRGLSPVVATVLLLVLVFVLAAIIFIWARSFVGEQIQKFGEPIENICARVDFEVDVSGGTYGNENGDFANRGDVPIYNFEIKEKYADGNSEMMSFYFVESSGVSLDVAEAKTGPLNLKDNPEEIIIYPTILGNVGDGEGGQPYTCFEHGKAIQL